jgi:hypothetical protein
MGLRGDTGDTGIGCSGPIIENLFMAVISEGTQSRPISISICKVECPLFSIVNLTVPSTEIDLSLIDIIRTDGNIIFFVDNARTTEYTLPIECRPSCELLFDYSYFERTGITDIAIHGFLKIDTDGHITLIPSDGDPSSNFSRDVKLKCNSVTYCV